MAAILSSNEDVVISNRYAFAAEVGLSGEVRSVNRVEARIAEADKLGMEKIFVSKYNCRGLDTSKFNVEVVPIASVTDLLRKLL